MISRDDSLNPLEKSVDTTSSLARGNSSPIIYGQYNARNEDSAINLVYPMRESWNVLIVLDACRFDYMQKIYSDYFPQGKLTKRLSPGTWTLEWASKVFTDSYQDCVYVSANPFIRGSNIGSSNGFGHKGLLRYNAGEHFYKILDVWRTHWDNNLGTVLPDGVSEVALGAIKSYPAKRLILHYMQPHYPYLGLDETKGRRPSRHDGYVRAGLVRIFGSRIGNTLGKTIAPSCEEWTAKKIGIERFKQAYEQNLRVVLESISRLLRQLNGKIVITADHGELLGEGGQFGHPQRLRTFPQLFEIPWLEVSATSTAFTGQTSSSNVDFLEQGDEELLRNRLRALGYE